MNEKDVKRLVEEFKTLRTALENANENQLAVARAGFFDFCFTKVLTIADALDEEREHSQSLRDFAAKVRDACKTATTLDGLDSKVSNALRELDERRNS